VPGKPGRKKGINLTHRLARQLRELIRTGEWQPGYLVPSQKELSEEHDVSEVTARNAVKILKNEGLVTGGQGRQWVVADRTPVHGLVFDPNPTSRLSEPRAPFRRAGETGTARRRWTVDVVVVPGSVAIEFGLEPESGIVERAMLLTVDDEPVLTSTSYLPADLAGHDDGEWRDADVGQLALTGHDVEALPPRGWPRMPTPEERETLRVDPEGVPVTVVHYPYRVLTDAGTVRAGVTVTARGDRVFLE